MIVAEAPAKDFCQRLEKGLLLQTGPFTVHVRSDIEGFGRLFQEFYAGFPLLPEPAIADFHVQLKRKRGIRRRVSPQVQFLLDSQAPFLPYPLDHAFPLFEWGLNWCIAMHAHQYLMLHSAAVERGGRVMLLPAWPGCGKSTLCAALVTCGWRLFSDEFGLVRHEDGQLLPMPRPIPLKNQSIDVIREFSPGAELGPSFHGTRKGTVAHLRSTALNIEQASVTAPPGWVVFPRYLPGVPLRLEAIVKPQAFMKLANNSFNYQLSGLQGFKAVTRLVRTCSCYMLSYSKLDEAVDALNRLVEA